MYRRGARSIPPLGHSQQPSRLSKRILQGNQSRRTCTLQRPRMHATQHTSHQLQRRRHALRVPGRVRQHCAAPASARARYHHPAAQVCVPGVAAQLRCPGGNPETVRDHGPCQRPRTGAQPPTSPQTPLMASTHASVAHVGHSHRRSSHLCAHTFKRSRPPSCPTHDVTMAARRTFVTNGRRETDAGLDTCFGGLRPRLFSHRSRLFSHQLRQGAPGCTHGASEKRRTRMHQPTVLAVPMP